MTLTIHDYETVNELDLQLTEYVVQVLKTALAERETASLVLSGGSTPKAFLHNLSEQDLDWGSVYITLADERCVLDVHPDSNAKMVKEQLLQNLASEANFVPLYIQGESALNCQQRFINHRVLSDTYDLVILGMGGDGHTASIFPEAIERDQALNINTQSNVLLTNPVTVKPLRLTQTRKRLLNTRSLALHFVGEQKRAVFDRAVESINPNLPISYFIHQDLVPLSVFYSAAA
ncbi:6-phosphogluconolactonase [Halioxenophilus sp. WMMB6]|uniref:6-phosphogluconolactonase n=1 Tax=Halioxenophilus sp. WMMB6 TaxID=3073815 RepID=UPI00295EB108|nr:6-phosphogluconolactonase [Halioxenophilus sp. WMMB6]